MSNYNTKWIFEFIDKATAPIKKLQENVSNLGKCFNRLRAVDLAALSYSVDNVKNMFNGFSDAAIKNESALAEVATITGLTGKSLDELNDKAKGLAKTYGENVNENLDAFKTILSRLGPDMGSSSEAMELLGKNVNILSKGMEGDVKGATDAITTSMLQFQTDLSDPVKAAQESTRMINVMSAGAKEGAAEIPQISEALVQAGVSAKLAGLSFEETNSAIQAMAGGGKYGSEAGVAIRNVITNMSSQTKLTPDAIAILKAYGVNMKKMADSTVPFSERLKELKPLQHDINALTEIFGRENAASAQILIRSAEEQENLTQTITGTNVAYDQANIIMDTTEEKQKRMSQRFELLKINIGNLTKGFQPYLNMIANGVMVTANLANAQKGLMIVLNAVKMLTGIDAAIKFINTRITANLTKKQAELAGATSGVGIASVLSSIGVLTMAAAMQVLRTSINAVSTAIYNIPIIGWILALIAALTALFVWLWDNFGKFRGFFYGIWEVIKLVFGWLVDYVRLQINVVITIFKWLWNQAKNIFQSIGGVISSVWEWVGEKFSWALDFISGIVERIWSVVKYVFGTISGFIKSTFQAVWDFISPIFDWIREKIEGFLEFIKPLTDLIGGLWDKVKGAFNKGMKKGEKEVADKKEQKEQAKQTGDAVAKSLQNKGVVGGDPAVNAAGGTTIDYDALFAKKGKGSKSASRAGVGADGGMSISGEKGGNRTINMTVNIINHFSAAKQAVGDIADKIAGAVNDRLRDGLVAIN